MTKKFALIAAIAILISVNITHASMVFNVQALRLNDQSGNAVTAGTLLQLVDLGADGVFNQITVAPTDPNGITGLNRWVSGDDTVLDIAVIGNSDNALYPSTKAFDLTDGADGSGGIFGRSWEMNTAGFPTNRPFGLRWFSGIQASTFDALTAANGLASGQRYGEFTRQSSAQYGGILWITDGTPADLEEFLYDPLITINSGGLDANILGNASQTVVPEPSSTLLALISIVSLCGIRRRKQ